MKLKWYTFLQNSLSSVDDLIKKHDGFAKTLEAQEEKIDTLEQLAQALLAQEHYASDHIRSRCQGVLDRRDKVKQVRISRLLRLLSLTIFQLMYARQSCEFHVMPCKDLRTIKCI